MSNKFKQIIDDLCDTEKLIIGDKRFSNELILDKYLHSSMLGTINFYNINFDQIGLSTSHFINCRFEDCTFHGVRFQKSEFWNPIFENCQITNCNWTQANFYKTTFRNCVFVNSDLTASTISESKFISTKFQNTGLKQVAIHSVKIWKSDQCIEISNSFDFENFLIEYKNDI